MYCRPCLIISANSFNISRISTVIAAIITSIYGWQKPQARCACRRAAQGSPNRQW
ncbi:hypothetical protein [Candidatus Accumulibacter phosphatis]|uniref:hypothetical protein n=1 Tax=Candidatus Accumulibacter phosphatis TaxID=327160 RepID=UPI003D7C3487